MIRAATHKRILVLQQEPADISRSFVDNETGRNNKLPAQEEKKRVVHGSTGIPLIIYVVRVYADAHNARCGWKPNAWLRRKCGLSVSVALIVVKSFFFFY